MSSSNDGIRLRSAQWYAGDDRNAYLHRAWMRRGVPSDAFTGRPHTAIANTASDLTPCNAHLTEVAASVTVCTRPAASRRSVAGRNATKHSCRRCTRPRRLLRPANARRLVMARLREHGVGRVRDQLEQVSQPSEQPCSSPKVCTVFSRSRRFGANPSQTRAKEMPRKSKAIALVF